MQHDLEIWRRRVAMAISAVYHASECETWPMCAVESADDDFVVRIVLPELVPLGTHFCIERTVEENYRITDDQIFDAVIAASADDLRGEVNFDNVTRVLCSFIDAAELEIERNDATGNCLFRSGPVTVEQLPVAAARYVRALRLALA